LYGFNGMEKDDEMKNSTGNSYTTMFRQYDPRLGRFMSRDPIVYPWQSDYAAFNNNPIYFADPSGAEGDDGKVKTPKGGATGDKPKAKDAFGNDLEHLPSSPSGPLELEAEIDESVTPQEVKNEIINQNMNWVGHDNVARRDNTAYIPNHVLNSGNYGEPSRVFYGHDIGASGGAGIGIDVVQTQIEVPHGSGYWEGGQRLMQKYSGGVNADPVPNIGGFLGGVNITVKTLPVGGSLVRTLNSANGFPENYSIGAGEIIGGEYYRSNGMNNNGNTVFTVVSSRFVLGVGALPVTAAMGTSPWSASWEIMGGTMTKWDSVEAAYYNAIKPVFGWEDSLKTKGFSIKGLAPHMK